MTDRQKIMEMLRQLEIHSPKWIGEIRAYIVKIEAKAK